MVLHKRGGILVGVILLSLTPCVGMAEPATQNASGPQVDYIAELNALVKKGSDESLNAEPFYRRAFALYVRPPIKVSAREVDAWPTELGEKQRSALKKWIEANSEALTQLQFGTEKPFCWFQYQGLSTWDIDQVGHMQRMRELFFALVLRAKLRAAEGDQKGAIADVLVCYRFGRDMKSRPVLSEQLAGLASLANTLKAAYQILQKASVDSTLLAVLQQWFEEHSRDQDLVVDLRGWKLTTLDAVQRTALGGPKNETQVRDMEDFRLKMSDFIGTYIPPDQLNAYMHNCTREEMARLTETAYAYYSSIISKTPFQWKEEGIDLDSSERGLIADNPLLYMLRPAVANQSEASSRYRAARGALIVVLSVLRHQNDKGILPCDPQTLVSSGYIRQLPMDPYSDKPLVYKRTEDSFVLYSIGADFKDNGGAHSPKWGVEARGGDFVFWPVQTE